MTQKELSKNLNVSQGYISKLENRCFNNINRKVIFKLCCILNIDDS